MARHPYDIPDPWRVRVREWLAKHLWCPLVGHAPVVKMDGTVLCQRHD